MTTIETPPVISRLWKSVLSLGVLTVILGAAVLVWTGLALAFRRLRHHWRGPRLVALAYSFQVVPQVPVTATDVMMDTIVTEMGIDELLAHEDRAVDLRGR